MKAEVINKVLSLAEPHYQTFKNDRGAEYVFADKIFNLVSKSNERPSLIKVSTLSAIVELFKLDFEKMRDANPVAVINSPTSVAVVSSQSDKFYNRTFFIDAAAPESDRNFKFNDWHGQEAFLIGLNSCFQDGGDRDQIVRKVSSLATKDALEIEDDGFTQSATAKTGVSLASHVELKPRVKLTPWRTFREADQPESEFLLRVKKGNDGLPYIALFEADGGAWKVTAVNYVAAWLHEHLPKDDSGASEMLVVS